MFFWLADGQEAMTFRPGLSARVETELYIKRILESLE